MATTFKKGDAVRLNASIPQGVVSAMRMDEEGAVSYLMTWTDDTDVEQQRWFTESELVAA
jgi:uncharacterized protein YodC (DUF2158 family)